MKNMYPKWVCNDCALLVGGKWPKGHVATFHPDTCEVCGQLRTVTEPRDWGHFEQYRVEEIRTKKGYYDNGE